MVLGLFLLFNGITGNELLDKIDSVSTYPHSAGIMEQTIITTTGKKRTFKIRTFTRDGSNYQLMVYLYPPQVEGIAFLIKGDDVWAYFPQTGRVRRIASHAKKQRMMGSDFTYEDMTIGTYRKKFRPGELKEEKDKYILSLIPTRDSNISYDKLVLYVNKENFVPERIDFYKNGEKNPYKSLLQEDIKVVDGIPTPMHIVMKNNKTGSSTEVRILEIHYKTEVNKNIFSPDYLKEASER